MRFDEGGGGVGGWAVDLDQSKAQTLPASTLSASARCLHCGLSKSRPREVYASQLGKRAYENFQTPRSVFPTACASSKGRLRARRGVLGGPGHEGQRLTNKELSSVRAPRCNHYPLSDKQMKDQIQVPLEVAVRRLPGSRMVRL